MNGGREFGGIALPARGRGAFELIRRWLFGVATTLASEGVIAGGFTLVCLARSDLLRRVAERQRTR